MDFASIPLAAGNTPRGEDPIASYQKGFGLAQGIKNAPLERQKLEAGAQEAQTNAASNKLAAIGNILAQVKDQDSYQQAATLLHRSGIINANDIPAQYDPAYVDLHKNSILNSKAQLDKQYKLAAIDEMKAGGSTGVFANRLRDEPDLKDAYFNKVNAGKGLTKNPVTGQVENMPGYNPAVAATAGAESEQKEIGKQKGEVTGKQIKREFTASESIPMLENIDRLLNDASGGGVSSLYQKAKGVAGVSDSSTQANRQLKQLSGYLTSNVPRMEGPQSDYDVAAYKEMAGSLGDESLPVEDRRAVLKQMLAMQAHYSNDPKMLEKYPGYMTFDGQPENARIASEPLSAQAPAIKEQLARKNNMPQKGLVKNGYIFNGGDPAKQENWKKVK